MMADCPSTVTTAATTATAAAAAAATTVEAVNADVVAVVAAPPAAVAHLFGSFHYIVQEQAKSMVAIQVTFEKYYYSIIINNSTCRQ